MKNIGIASVYLEIDGLLIRITHQNTLQQERMLSRLNWISKRGINVYSGVSPSLLATMSLAQDIKGHDQHSLVDSLNKAKLISSKAQEDAWRTIDRSYFTKNPTPYANRPCRISKGQNMTDIFTQAVMVNSIEKSWGSNARVLDIGTGHGYIAFLMAKILANSNCKDYRVQGIDIYKEAIDESLAIKAKHFPELKGLEFECIDLKEFLEKDQGQYDAILGGFFIDETMSERLTERLKIDGVGVWPTRSQQGQALFKIQPNSPKTYLIQTLFSMPVVRSSVSRYFIQPDQQMNEPQSSPEQEEQVKLEERVRLRKERELKLRGELKVLIDRQRKSEGRILSLSEMREVPQIREKLLQLQKLPKTKIK